MNPINVTLPVTVVKGKGRGKKMGIPTLNFAIPKTLKLPHGVYAGWLIAGKYKYQAAIHFSPRPQFNETDPSLEAYLLQNAIIPQNTELQLTFSAFIRNVQKFPSVSEMLKRIAVDVKEINKILLQL